MEGRDARFILKHSVGVSFHEQERTLIPITGKTDMSFTLQVPSSPRMFRLDLERQVIQRCSNDSAFFNEFCWTLWDEIHQSLQLENMLIESLNKDHSEIQQQLTLMSIGRRRLRKELIPAGNLLSFLLGTASMDHVRNLQSHIRNLYSNVQQAKDDRDSLFEAIQGVTNITDTRFGHILHHIKETDNILLESVRNMTMINSKVDEIYAAFANPDGYTKIHSLQIQHLSILQRNERLILASNKLRDFKLGLMSVHRGFLPNFIITEDMLSEALHKTNKHVKEKHPSLTVLTDRKHLHLYYEDKAVYGTFLDDTLFIHLQVPLVTQFTSYDVYKVDIYPMPIHSEDGNNQKGYTILENTPDYLVVSKGREKYTTLTEKQYQECTTMRSNLCIHLNILHSKAKSSCLWAIFTDDHVEMDKLCVFKTYIHEELPETIIPVTRNEYLLINVPTPISMWCNSGKKYIEIANYTLLKIQCDCTMIMQNTIIEATVSSCQEIEGTHKVRYPVAYPVAAAFDFSKHFKHPHTSFSTAERPRIPIPELSQYKELLEQDLKVDASLGYETKSLVKHVKRYRKKMSHPMQTIKIQGGLMSQTQTYMLFALAIWNILLTVGLTYMACKFRTLLPMAVTNTLPPIDAFIIPTESVTPQADISDATPSIVTFVVVGTAIVVCIYKLMQIFDMARWRCIFGRKIWRFVTPSSQNQKMSIFLKISTVTEVHLIYLLDINYDEHTTIFKFVPKLDNIGIYMHFCQPTAILEWEDAMKIQYGNREFKLDLPTYVKISWTTYQGVSSLLANDEDGQSFSQLK